MMHLMLVTMLLMTTRVAGQDTENCTVDEALYGIDRDVDPCDNFYQYACGGWLQNQFLTAERQRIRFRDTDIPLGATRNLLTQGVEEGDSVAVIKAKSLYDSCYSHAPDDVSSLTVGQIVTNMATGWTFACDFCDTSSFDLEDFLFKAMSIDVHPLFRLSSRVHEVEAVDATKHVKPHLHIDEPTLQLPLKDYLILTYESQLTMVYRDKIIAGLRRFGIINETLAREHAEDVVAAEQHIAELAFNGLNGETTNKSSLNLLDENYGELINWTRFVKRIAAMEEIGIHDIEFDETVYIRSPDALLQIINYFIDLPNTTQINYLQWRLVDSLESVIVKPEDKINDIILYYAEEPFDKEYRVEPCVWFVTKIFPLVVHRMMYAEHLTTETLQTVNVMIQQIQYEFTSLLGAHDWLDQEAKRVIQDKIDSMTTVVSYLREAMNDTFLFYYYNNASIDRINDPVRGNFFDNIPIVKKDAFVKNFRTIRELVRYDQDNLPQIFNMFNVAQLHQLVLTPTVFQYPWFLDEAPMVVNYAGLGTVIGYELLHSFNIEGIKIHRNGTTGNWFGDAATAEFDTRVRCLINQYNHYFYTKRHGQGATIGLRGTRDWSRRCVSDDSPAISVWTLDRIQPSVKLGESAVFVHCGQLSGRRTATENIADNGRFKLAYKAYLNYTNTATTRQLNFTHTHFSNDKLFFIRAAQMWCQKETPWKAKETFLGNYSPPEFRVNGPLQNFMEFADVFRCPSGSPMNPVKKCVVW